MPLTKLSGIQIETPVDISAANLTGITTATDLNAYIQQICIQNGLYLINASGQYVYYLTLLYSV